MASSPETPKSKTVAIVGAGPVGALAGLYFSHAGWNVTVYDLRGGMASFPTYLCIV
jgi:kynurenine 3-monooxygenase